MQAKANEVTSSESPGSGQAPPMKDISGYFGAVVSSKQKKKKSEPLLDVYDIVPKWLWDSGAGSNFLNEENIPDAVLEHI